MTLATLCHDLRALEAIKNYGLWLTLMTPGRVLRALDSINKLGLWLT